MLRCRPLSEIEAALRNVAEQLGSTEQTCADHRMMTPEEVRALVSDDLVEVGGHTRTHVMLSAVPAEDQLREIGEGRAILESIVDAPVTSFAYPFGAWGEYNRASVRAVRDAGYEAACTTRNGLVSALFGRFRIPRFMVLDWEASTFAAALEHWFAGRRAPQSF
jgi:peptidoglycan/xylan/chitin deacetylase (PgdA/CDA1 family)